MGEQGKGNAQLSKINTINIFSIIYFSCNKLIYCLDKFIVWLYIKKSAKIEYISPPPNENKRDIRGIKPIA